MYNKKRELDYGKPIIKLSREYKYLFFNYLGFKDLQEFLQTSHLAQEQKSKQLELLDQRETYNTSFYVSYYFGEDNKMCKGVVIINNQWKSIEMKYIYKDEEGLVSTYEFFGNIVHSDNFVNFDTKYFNGTKKKEGAKFIFFVGKSSPNERDYLIGTYSGFDKYDQTIAGKMILKKYKNKIEVQEEVANKHFDPIISQELIKGRFIVGSNIRKNPQLFSKKSPYSQALFNSAGNYLAYFIMGDKSISIKIEIENEHYNILSTEDSIIIEDDSVSILNKGQILNLDFAITGMFYLQKVSIYIKKNNFANGNSEEEEGNFTGIDVNNNLISGTTVLKRISA